VREETGEYHAVKDRRWRQMARMVITGEVIISPQVSVHVGIIVNARGRRGVVISGAVRGVRAYAREDNIAIRQSRAVEWCAAAGVENATHQHSQ